ncbi:unnamed protein product [Cyprideis torosa]|uniref:Uncharacterized protein n=1 Tax=Cyprideis torosa TaxID=163714 RepID=A0A7R8ZVD7_9CRUS|nr:unnamed protein product [Cyprideis torosa]CAG0902524.1 unnamed protein product [Cyprideis torosa]
MVPTRWIKAAKEAKSPGEIRGLSKLVDSAGQPENYLRCFSHRLYAAASSNSLQLRSAYFEYLYKLFRSPLQDSPEDVMPLLRRNHDIKGLIQQLGKETDSNAVSHLSKFLHSILFSSPPAPEDDQEPFLRARLPLFRALAVKDLTAVERICYALEPEMALCLCKCIAEDMSKCLKNLLKARSLEELNGEKVAQNRERKKAAKKTKSVSTVGGVRKSPRRDSDLSTDTSPRMDPEKQSVRAPLQEITFSGNKNSKRSVTDTQKMANYDCHHQSFAPREKDETTILDLLNDIWEHPTSEPILNGAVFLEQPIMVEKLAELCILVQKHFSSYKSEIATSLLEKLGQVGLFLLIFYEANITPSMNEFALLLGSRCGYQATDNFVSQCLRLIRELEDETDDRLEVLVSTLVNCDRYDDLYELIMQSLVWCSANPNGPVVVFPGDLSSCPHSISDQSDASSVDGRPMKRVRFKLDRSLNVAKPEVARKAFRFLQADENVVFQWDQEVLSIIDSY